ncbi:hypothetical protein G6L28_12380 [Agrobacterium larrymoorei]|nr:hypothetical protein [Agrobacterium larrymoorei]NTJ43394.1 hypothetical protein [Agrobacterium larrymoorei]
MPVVFIVLPNACNVRDEFEEISHNGCSWGKFALWYRDNMIHEPGTA